MNLQKFKESLASVTVESVEDLLSGKNLDQKIQEILKNGLKKEDMDLFWSPKANWGISVADMSKKDLSNVELNALLRTRFSTETIWPSADKLPVNFNPKELIDKAKRFKGLGVEKLHQSGIKGESVTIAYIDKPFDLEHVEFKDRNIEYVDLSEGQDFDFHGYAVMSRLCGKNIGIAPAAKVIYYAQKQGGKDHCFDLVKSGLKALKDIIKRIKNNEKIDAIGQSADLEYQISFIQDESKRDLLTKELKKLNEELVKLDIPFIDAGCFWDKGFAYSFNFDPTSNDENQLISYGNFEKKKDVVNVVEAGKCIPMPYTTDGYLYENSVGCASWSIPQLVGMYALAKQVDRDLSFEDFVKTSKSTAKTNKNGIKLLDSEELIKEIEYKMENRNTF